ncbi:MAG: hypothetical protein RL215_1410 [Planctomycetota bacterium]|jgi:hypothetical protein
MSPATVQRYLFWIDGVGTWLVICGRSMVLGGAVESSSADIRLMAPLSRRYAAFEQSGEGWMLRMLDGGAPARVLVSGRSIDFAGRVSLEFRVPSVLSLSAVLRPEVPQRLVPYADGVVLLADRMLLGARRDAHICCPQLDEYLVFYADGGRLWCRSAAAFEVNGGVSSGAAGLVGGDVIAVGDFRVRIEDMVGREVGR